MSYFPPHGHIRNGIIVELDLSNYASKSDLKNAKKVYTLQFAKIDNLANLDAKIKDIEDKYLLLLA